MTETTQQQYETVIGLEVHLQLSTKTKIFCGCAIVFGKAPNTQTCPVCLGLPGTLPVLNKQVLDYSIKVAIALNFSVNSFIKFDRKNYYYPDLPKGYQISQFDHPIASDGHIMIPIGENNFKRINITRAHMEEDAGKLIHDNASNASLVDYNRTGTPLLEIVSEPELRSAQEAYDYLQTLKLTLQYCNVSDCDMEKGSLRCDANVSIRPVGETELGTKTELKNLNSFKAVKASIEYEVKRQKSVLEAGEKIIQETRLWDENKLISQSMRSKEEAHDYKYFPEPDLVPFTIEASVIDEIAKTIVEGPQEKRERLVKDYAISDYDARILIQDPELSRFFEECTKTYKDTKKICNWINGQVLTELNSRKTKIANISLKPENLTQLMDQLDSGVINNLAAKDVLGLMIDSGQSADTIIKEKGLAQVSDDGTLDKIVDELIQEHQTIVTQIKEGKESAIGFLVGQAMRKTQGKANPKKIGDIIKRRLLHA